MKYRHYAPNTKCVLVVSEQEEKIREKIQELLAENPKRLVIGKTKNLCYYATDYKLDMGNTLEEISQRIFNLLRQADNYPVEEVVIEGVTKEGLGLAIMNRLLRTCEYHVIRC